MFQISVAGTFLVFSGFTLMGAIFFATLMPEVKGVAKELLPQLFLKADSNYERK
jgi:hypothetical protein